MTDDREFTFQTMGLVVSPKHFRLCCLLSFLTHDRLSKIKCQIDILLLQTLFNRVKVIAQILVLCVLTRHYGWWFGAENVIVARRSQSILFKHDRICEKVISQVQRTQIFTVVFPTHNKLQTWQWANLHVKNIDKEKGHVFRMVTQWATCTGVLVCVT